MMSSNDHLQLIVLQKFIHSTCLRCLAVMTCSFCFLSAAELYASQLQQDLPHLMQQLSCRLWPTAVNLSPAQLQPVAASIVRCFIDNGYAVFWIPSVTSAAYSGGEWVNATQACFLSADDKAATPLVADVARRAALKIPDLPKHALEVQPQQCCNEHVRIL